VSASLIYVSHSNNVSGISSVLHGRSPAFHPNIAGDVCVFAITLMAVLFPGISSASPSTTAPVMTYLTEQPAGLCQ